ncbi:MAG: epoxide hydrolase family protein [Stackebrandtia sp.]
MTAEITPFRVAIPQADVDGLRTRLAETRWPAELPEIGWERGVPVGYLKELVEYWAGEYDWRGAEAELNSFPQFTTDVDGQTIHFLHIRSSEPDATPLLMSHGWPSSPVEFAKVVGPLTEPRVHGGGGPAFHLVIPSLPGFGFSTPMATTGWGDLGRVAGAYLELMSRLGYERFAVHGGDIGAGVTAMLAMLGGDRVTATHVNGPTPFPLGADIDTDALSGQDKVRAERFNEFKRDGSGYLHIQSSRPQTLAYSLNDSPVGQLAWIVEKFAEWTDPAKALPEQAVDRDQLLTLVSVYWFTGSGASAAHFTYEGMQVFRRLAESGELPADGEAPAGPPQGVAVYAADNSIRSLVDPQGAVDSWTEYDTGGHFPAMETPGVMVDELRSFFGSVGTIGT